MTSLHDSRDSGDEVQDGGTTTQHLMSCRMLVCCIVKNKKVFIDDVLIKNIEILTLKNNI